MANFLISRTFFLSLFFILCLAKPKSSHAQIAVSLSADKSTMCPRDTITFIVSPYKVDYKYELRNSNNDSIIVTSRSNIILIDAFNNTTNAPIKITVYAKINSDLPGVPEFVNSSPFTITINPRPAEAQYDNTLNYNFTKLDDVVSLGLYLKNIGTSTIVNEWFVPFSNAILQGTGQNNFLFIPSEASSLSGLELHYSMSNTHNCFAEYTVPYPFSVVNPLSSAPAFVHNLNPSGPICEQSESVHFSVYGLNGFIERIDLVYNDHVETVFSGHSFLVNNLTLKPRLHTPNKYSIPIKVWVEGNSNPVVDYISIYPKRKVDINGILKSSTDDATYKDSASVCAANKDTLVVSGFPTGGTFSFALCSKDNFACNCIDPICFNSLPNLGIKLDPSNSSFKFIPEEVFKQLGKSNYTSVVDISYTYPASAIGACPETRHLYLRFNAPTNLTFTTIPSNAPYCQSDTLKLKLKNNIKGDKAMINYGDGFSTLNYDTATSYSHYYNKPGKYAIRFKTMREMSTCNNDIIDTIRLGAKPVANFDVKNNYEKTITKFSSLAVVKVKNNVLDNGLADKINSWSWYYGNGTSSLNKSDSISYATYEHYKARPYSVTHIVKAAWGCSDTVTKSIPIFPIINLAKFRYKQNFDVSDSTGFYQSANYSIGGNSSWKYKTPSGSIINSDSPAWVTDNGEKDTSYNSSEYSWIESPAFNLAQLALPVLSIDTWCLTEYQLDGACLQWAFADTCFGKENWETIGLKDEGVNWYNSNLVVSMLSTVKNNGLFHPGWTGSTGNRWLNSRYNLDVIKAKAGSRAIRFRILFVSNADNAPGKYDGFAFDNFSIGERNRKVIIEEFCDYENFETGFTQTEIKNNKQLIRIQYHSGFIHPDDKINKDNLGEIGARNLLYGYSTLPRATVDGIYTDDRYSFFGNAGENNFKTRQLETAPYTITIDQVNVYNNELNFKVSLTRNSLLNNKGPFTIQVAVLEDSVYSNDRPFTNVFRKFLPNAAGQHIENKDWAINETKTIDRLFTPFVKLTPRLDNDTSLLLVAFIQDETSNEIYQAEAHYVKFKDVKGLQPKSLPLRLSSFKDISLYPNPAEEHINIRFGDSIIEETTTYRILDVYGKIVYSGVVEKDTSEINLLIHFLPVGFYQFQLMNNVYADSKSFSIVR
jgi:hypothetical protein